MSAGVPWFEWIGKQVADCKLALVLLSPTSLSKPWVLWEAGAVFGSVHAMPKSTSRRRVVPLSFRVPPNLLPGPFAHVETKAGDDSATMQAFMETLMDPESGLLEQHDKGIEFYKRLTKKLPDYIDSVENALLRAPTSPTEPMIGEWLLRLDGHHAIDVETLADWLEVAFGRTGKDRGQPLDLRLHRRLGDLALDQKRFEAAVAQFRLARTTAPRDLFVLRRLGQALLALAQKKRESGGRADVASTLHKEVDDILTYMQDLSPRILQTNVESAALAARLHREQNDWRSALHVLKKACAHNPDSGYLSVLFAQASLAAGDAEEGVKIYASRARDARQREKPDFWTLSTIAEDAYLRDDVETLERTMQQMVELEHTASNRKTFDDGLELLRKLTNRPEPAPRLPNSVQVKEKDGSAP